MSAGSRILLFLILLITVPILTGAEVNENSTFLTGENPGEISGPDQVIPSVPDNGVEGGETGDDMNLEEEELPADSVDTEDAGTEEDTNLIITDNTETPGENKDPVTVTDPETIAPEEEIQEKIDERIESAYSTLLTSSPPVIEQDPDNVNDIPGDTYEGGDPEDFSLSTSSSDNSDTTTVADEMETLATTTPFKIDPSTMNTAGGGYSQTTGYGWIDGGGSENSYFRITLSSIAEYPVEFHLVSSFTTKAMYAILIQASYVTISGIDLTASSTGSSEQVNTITHTGTGGAITVESGYTGVKLVNVDVDASNGPAVKVDGSSVDIIGTDNPDAYLTSYNGGATNEHWGTSLTSTATNGYGYGLLQQSTSRPSSITVTGDGGGGVSVSGSYTGAEVNQGTLALGGDNITITGTGSASTKDSGVTVIGTGTLTSTATNTHITGQEYGISANTGRISITGSDSRISGGRSGIYLTGDRGSSGTGGVTIGEDVGVSGSTGYAIELDGPANYVGDRAITLSNSSNLDGGLGKTGGAPGSGNEVISDNAAVTISSGTGSPDYQVTITLSAISGSEPYNLRILDEEGDLIYLIDDWENLPAGVTYDDIAGTVSFSSGTFSIYTAVKEEIPAPAPGGSEPESVEAVSMESEEEGEPTLEDVAQLEGELADPSEVVREAAIDSIHGIIFLSGASVEVKSAAAEALADSVRSAPAAASISGVTILGAILTSTDVSAEAKESTRAALYLVFTGESSPEIKSAATVAVAGSLAANPLLATGDDIRILSVAAGSGEITGDAAQASLDTTVTLLKTGSVETITIQELITLLVQEYPDTLDMSGLMALADDPLIDPEIRDWISGL